MGANPHGNAAHTPVLLEKVIAALRPDRGDRFIDGTLGAGGHAVGLLQAAGPKTELLGIDRDPQALELAAESLSPFRERVHLRQGSYHQMAELAAQIGWERVDGVLLDLGLSSMQLDDPSRGFAFRLEGPLDMRFGPS
ncbi:MAG: 16S rRNA (cytosine(1402)-N(4))-methyltransferase, partial [Anaerolineales bacterium]